MLGRCYRTTDAAFADYGGRGIKVCQRWLDSFENFLADMGSRPSMQHSLDRRDGNGDYEPNNCRWATKSEQAQNRRHNRMVIVDDRSMSIRDACTLLGKDFKLVQLRLNKGWSFEDAISRPKRRW
ncbi:MAG: hypothetical protein C5B54_09170 [Acidobacteria bacterium]|nr:MAG: hypothetical protein C5B54_09170 [Acidobacteriota bacterium]